MNKISYVMLKNREKMQIRAYSILILLLILTVGYYFYNKWTAYNGYASVADAHAEFIVELQDEVADQKALYDTNKEDFDALNDEISENLNTIFPLEDNYTQLTRSLESFELDLSTTRNPFEISNIDFQNVVETDLYSILPFRMNIRSSAENFRKFLHAVETSGSLNDQVRLMEVSSIRINFEDFDGRRDASDIISFTVHINAYFQ